MTYETEDGRLIELDDAETDRLRGKYGNKSLSQESETETDEPCVPGFCGCERCSTCLDCTSLIGRTRMALENLRDTESIARLEGMAEQNDYAIKSLNGEEVQPGGLASIADAEYRAAYIEADSLTDQLAEPCKACGHAPRDRAEGCEEILFAGLD